MYTSAEMPSTKEGCRPPRKMDAGVVEAMASRQHKNNLSELGVNWLGNGHLNASESDIMYKYHVVSAAFSTTLCRRAERA